MACSNVVRFCITQRRVSISSMFMFSADLCSCHWIKRRSERIQWRNIRSCDGRVSRSRRQGAPPVTRQFEGCKTLTVWQYSWLASARRQPTPDVDSLYLHPAMIARQRQRADVAWVDAGGSPPRARPLTMSLSAVGRTMRDCLVTGNGYGVVFIVSLLVQTFSGCSAGQLDGQYKVMVLRVLPVLLSSTLFSAEIKLIRIIRAFTLIIGVNNMISHCGNKCKQRTANA